MDVCVWQNAGGIYKALFDYVVNQPAQSKPEQEVDSHGKLVKDASGQ